MVLDKKTLRNIFIGVGICIVLYWGLHDTERVQKIVDVFSNMLSPFIFGAGLAFVLNVPMRAFEGLLTAIPNQTLRRCLALLMTFAFVLLILALVFWLLIPQIGDTIKTLIPQLINFANEVQNRVMTFLNDNPELLEWINENTDLTKLDWGGMLEKTFTMVSDSVSTIVASTFTALGKIASGMMNAVIGIVFAIYCLFGKENLARQGRRLLYAILPEHFCDETIRVLRLANSTFSNFLSGQCVEVCILGSLFAVSMAIFRMPYIPLVSVLVAVTAFIPIVGAFVGCIFGAFFIFVQDPLLAVGFVIMFLILQQIENNMIYPRVVGTSIGLSGMWVLLAVAVGGEFFGVAGMFLMIPMASVLYTLLREFAHKRLNKRNIDPEKLVPQPPEVRWHFQEKRKKYIAKRKKSRDSEVVSDITEAETNAEQADAEQINEDPAEQ
jgi:predicted PurR-regulated permease PerM